MAGMIFIMSFPIVLILTLNYLGHHVDDGFAGASAGMTFASTLLINGMILIVISMFAKKKARNSFLSGVVYNSKVRPFFWRT